MTLITKDVEELIGSKVSTVSKRNGIFTVRKSYFYRHGFNEDKLAELILEHIPNIEILKKEDNWAPFRGGDSVAKGSHFMVTFKEV